MKYYSSSFSFIAYFYFLFHPPEHLQMDDLGEGDQGLAETKASMSSSTAIGKVSFI